MSHNVFCPYHLDFNVNGMLTHLLGRCLFCLEFRPNPIKEILSSKDKMKTKFLDGALFDLNQATVTI